MRQEFYGLLMAHFAIALMHEAALKADVDPDRLSFLHAVRVVRRKLPPSTLFPPQHRKAFHERVLDEILRSASPARRPRSAAASNERGRNWPLRRRHAKPMRPVVINEQFEVSDEYLG